MTIAFAVFAYGHADNAEPGLIIAADTEETLGDDTKLHRPKIAPFVRDNGACVIVGTGFGEHIDALTEQLGEMYEDGIGKTRRELRDAFGRCVKDFHVNHIDPYLRLPDPPECSLLIGIQESHDEPVVFLTERSTIRTITFERRHTAIGIGARTADVLLDRLYDDPMTGTKATILSAYIAFRVKESVPYCGQKTQIARLPYPFQKEPFPIGQFPYEWVEDLEKKFRTVWVHAERAFLNDLIQHEVARFTPPKPSTP